MAPKDRIFLVMILVVVLGGIASLIYGTTWGIGTGPDSAIYVGVARSFLQGKGLTIPFIENEVSPMTHYPPLYPLLLAAGGYADIDPLISAKYINILFFGGTISLAGLLIYLYTGSILIAFSGATMLACSPVILGVHLWASSEPPFLFFLLTSVYLLSKYLDLHKAAYLIGASIAAALLLLTRYAGLAFVGASFLLLLLGKKAERLDSMRGAMTFLCVSLAPTLLWILRNVITAGTAANRTFEIHLITLGHFALAVKTITSWFVPSSVPGFVAYLLLLVASAAIGVAYIVSVRADQDSNRSLLQLPSLILLFFGLYPLLLILTISLFDTKTPLDDRLLSPLYLLGVIFVFCLIGRLMTFRSTFAIRAVSVAIFAMLIGYYLISTGEMLKESHLQGLGLAGKSWKESEAVAKIKSLPENVVIYTNRPYAVYLLTGRTSLLIPEQPAGGPDAHYLNDVASMREQLKKKAAILLQFDVVESRWENLWHSPSTSFSDYSL